MPDLDLVQTEILRHWSGSNNVWEQECVRLAPSCRCFVIDNVNTYVRKVLDWTAAEILDMKGLCIRLPYDACLFQYDVKSSLEDRLKNSKLPKKVRVGVLAAYHDSNSGSMVLPAGSSIDKIMTGLEEGFMKLGFLVFSIPDGGRPRPVGIVRCTINGQGEVLEDIEVKMTSGVLPDFSQFTNLDPEEVVRRWKVKCQSETMPQDAAFYEAWSMVQSLTPVWYALSLLNCKNVRTKVECNHNGQNREYRRRHERKEWTLLDVPLINKVHSGEIKIGSGEKKGLHTVRGHFKEYTAEAPLLGKHVGRWWWGHTVRGSAAEGVVQKEYRPGGLPNPRLMNAIRGIV